MNIDTLQEIFSELNDIVIERENLAEKNAELHKVNDFLKGSNSELLEENKEIQEENIRIKKYSRYLETGSIEWRDKYKKLEADNTVLATICWAFIALHTFYFICNIIH